MQDNTALRITNDCLQAFPEAVRAYMDSAWTDAAHDNSLQGATQWLLESARIYNHAFAISRYLKNPLEKRFVQECKKAGAVLAVQWLDNFKNQYMLINGTPITIETNDKALKDTAEIIARDCHRQFYETKPATGSKAKNIRYYLFLTKTILAVYGVPYPLTEKEQQITDLAKAESRILGVMSRLVCAKWWRRQLRTLQARKLETACRCLGLTNKARGIYCSNATVFRRVSQKARNRELLEKLEAVNDEGQAFLLAELADKTTSNPVNRRNELMVRVRGCEEWAAADLGNWQAVFLTITCPPEYHAYNRHGKSYSHWNGSTPIECQEWLQQTWARTRAEWKRQRVAAFGFRVAEPHHDGTPHWHMLLWIASHQWRQAVDVYRGYVLGSNPTEARERRGFTCKRIDATTGEGSPAGYISKYICKNVDGRFENDQEMTAGAASKAKRVEAWASTWGIRQFQPIGQASVTVYREMRRTTQQQLELIGADCEEVEAIRDAADRADWKAYSDAQGGMCVERKAQPMRALHLVKRGEAGEPEINAYGEVVEHIKGVIYAGWLEIKTRLYEWKVQLLRPPLAGALGLCQ